jgi:hypothetical protein
MRTIIVGDVCSETQFYTVEKVNGTDVVLKNDDGESITVGKDYAEMFLSSASESLSEEKLSRTELIEKFLISTGVALTANFNKQVKETDVVKEIQESYENSTPKDFTTKLKKSVKKALEGEERVMIGRHWGSKDEFGRIHFTDMQIQKDPSKSYDTRQRLVDPRTLNWFICRGVKYSVK